MISRNYFCNYKPAARLDLALLLVLMDLLGYAMSPPPLGRLLGIAVFSSVESAY